MISVLELFCCFNGAIFFVHQLFGMRGKLDDERYERWVIKKKMNEKFYDWMIFIDNIFDIVSIFVLCNVICKLIG